MKNLTVKYQNSIQSSVFDCLYHLYDDINGDPYYIGIPKIEKSLPILDALIKEYNQHMTKNPAATPLKTDDFDSEKYENSIPCAIFDCLYQVYDDIDGDPYYIGIPKIEKALPVFDALIKKYKQGIEDGSIPITTHPKQ